MAEEPPQEGRPAYDLLDRLSRHLEGLNIRAYVDLFEKPWRLIGLNFVAGLARGVGFAVGFTLLGAAVIYVLSQSFVSHLPVIGQFIAQIVHIVQAELKTYNGGRPPVGGG